MTTNYQKIKAMSIDEMANFFDYELRDYYCCDRCDYQDANCTQDDCISHFMKFLNQESEEE